MAGEQRLIAPLKMLIRKAASQTCKKAFHVDLKILLIYRNQLEDLNWARPGATFHAMTVSPRFLHILPIDGTGYDQSVS